MRTNQIKRLLLFLLTIVVGITAWAADTTKPTTYKTEIKAVRVGSQSVDIFWHPAEDDVTPQAAITYYAYIAEGWGSGPYTREYVSKKNGTNHEFQNLKPNTKYRIFVTAADEAGNTFEYDLLKIETPSLDTQAPTVVDNRVFVTDYTETTISLKWAAAFDNQTPQDKLRYIVRCYQDKFDERDYGPFSINHHYFEEYFSVQGKNEITITDLEAGYRTYLWVVVRDEDNLGQNINDPLEPIVVTLPDYDGRKPSHLNSSDMFANAVSTETSISLSWQPATDNITPKEKMRYQVQYLDCKETGLSYSHFAHHGFKESCIECKKYLTTTPWMENVTSYKIEGLKPNTEYVVRLVAKDQAGHCIPYSGPGCQTDELWGWPYAMDITTKKIDTQPPYASNSTIKVTGNTENSISIKWEPATDDTTESDEINYKVFYQEITETDWWWFSSRHYNEYDTFCDITDLKPNTAYNIQVIAFDRKDKMFVYDPCTSLTLPSTDKVPPTVSNPRVRVANRTHNSITLEWDAATDDKTPKDQLLYSIDYPDGHAQTIGKTSYTVTGLAPSTTYRFEVAVTDNNHNESKYTPITVTTDADPYVDNTPPTATDKNIKVSDLSHNSFTLSWERATDNNTPKDQILYKVYLTNVKNPQPDDFWLVYQNHGISSYTMVGLKSSTTFSYLVEASDIDGNLVLYNIGSVTTKADPTVVQKYNLYVKSKQVTSANAADVLGDGGSVSYDANTNTLQFKDAHIDAGGENALSTSENLYIQLVGNNVIDGSIYTVGCHATMFCGNGKLSVYAKNKHIAYETNGDLMIKDGCTVQFYSDATYAMSLGGGTLTVNNSTLKANGGQAKETIVRCGDLELIGCEILSGHTYAYGNYTFYDEIGDLATDEIIIGNNANDKEKPTLVNNVINVYNVTDNSAMLAWDAAKDNLTMRYKLNYYVYLKQETDYDYEGYYESGQGMTTCLLENLEPSTTYNALVQVYDEAMNSSFYREVTFTTDAIQEDIYDLEVMNIVVTSTNCNDVLGDGGSVRYDNATKTLTLTKASLNGDDAINSLIPLTIILEENNELMGSMYNDQATTLGGTGSLFVYGKYAGVFGDDLTVKDGAKVQFNGTEGTSGLEVSGRIIVINSTLSVTSKGKVPTIASCEGLEMTGCGIITGQKYDSTTQKFYNEDGTEATNEIRIDPTGTIHKVRMIFLSAEQADIKMGETLTITANPYPAMATDKTVTWSSSNNGIASVDEYGNVTGLAPGYTIITCSANDGSGVEASCVVTVSVPLVTSITLSQTDVTTTVGSAFALSAVITPREAASSYVSWTTSNDKVAIVGSDGVVMAIGEGNATITCTAEDGSGVTASCNVTVMPNTIMATGITMDPETATLKIGETITLAAIVTPDDASDKSVIWSSSNDAIAAVDTYGTVRCLADGTATITATTNDGSNLSASCTLTCIDGIISIINDADGQESIYSTDGYRLPNAKRGLNIIVTKDGKSLKLMKK